MQNANSKKRRFAYTKEQRLLAGPQFQCVFDNVDCKQGGKYCTLLSARNSQGHSRLGLIVAKKKVRLAVQRNRLKRITRELFRLKYPQIETLTDSFDVIALFKSSSADATNEQLHSELDKQWSKLIAKRLELK